MSALSVSVRAYGLCVYALRCFPPSCRPSTLERHGACVKGRVDSSPSGPGRRPSSTYVPCAPDQSTLSVRPWGVHGGRVGVPYPLGVWCARQLGVWCAPAVLRPVQEGRTCRGRLGLSRCQCHDHLHNLGCLKYIRRTFLRPLSSNSGSSASYVSKYLNP